MSDILPNEITFSNVLFVTDFSPSSDLALPYAVALAMPYNGKVYLAHVIAPEMYEFVPPDFIPEVLKQITAYAERRMQRLVSTSDFRGIAHEVLLRQGEIWETLRAMCDKYKIDVIALGTGGRGAFQNVLMSSVAEKTLRLAHRPVLTVGLQSRELSGEKYPRSILFAMDFSMDCARAMAWAVSLAQKFEARLISLYVIPDFAQDPQTAAAFEQFFTQRLQELLPGPPRFQGRQEFRVEFGLAAAGILKTAADCDVDLIVMGIRGAGSLTRAAHHFGTTAHQVVSEARCPVLTVRG